MKTLVIRLLSAMGLVSAGRHRALEQTVDQLKAEAQSWKTRAGQANARSDALSSEIKQQAQLVEKLQQRVHDGNAMQERLATAERDLVTARELLMAVDVKLDILEGAANVLDMRTRAAISRQHSGTSASS